MWSIKEIKELAERKNLNLFNLLDLKEANNTIIDTLKCLRDNIKGEGKINVFIKDGKLFGQYIINTIPLISVNKNKEIFGNIKYPVSKEDMEMLTYLFAVDFAEEIGTSNKLFLGRRYPIEINGGEFNIGCQSENPKLVRSIYNNLVESK